MKTAFAIVLLASSAMAQKIPPKPLPDFLSGDECLFCHRGKIGDWQRNAHTLTVREKEDAPELMLMAAAQPELAKILPEITHYMGGITHARFLKKQGYGKMAILTPQAAINVQHQAMAWSNLSNPTWDGVKFQDRCSGCHMSAVDSVTKQFAQIGLDCYTCHGDAPLEHAKEPEHVMLSKPRLKKGTDSPRVLLSMCAQCHLRGGKSKTTGLPYPYNFVAGEDLFVDYQIDLAKSDDGALNPGDRHVYWNVREVLELGDKVTCIDCHQIHPQKTSLHEKVYVSRGPGAASTPAICAQCHLADMKTAIKYSVHSAACEY